MPGTFSEEFKQLNNIDINLTGQKRIITNAIPNYTPTNNLGEMMMIAGDRDVYFAYVDKKQPLLQGTREYKLCEVIPGRIRTLEAQTCGNAINYHRNNFAELICLNKKGYFLFSDSSKTGIVIQYMYKEANTGEIIYSSFPNLETFVIANGLHITGTPDGKYIFICYMKTNGDLGLVKIELVQNGTDIILMRNSIPKFVGYSATTNWVLKKLFYWNGYLYGVGNIDADTYTNEGRKRYFFKFDATTLDYLGIANEFTGSFSILGKDIYYPMFLYKDKLFLYGQFQGETPKIWRFDFATGQPEIGLQVSSKYGYNCSVFGIFGISQ